MKKTAENRTGSNKECQSHSKKASVFDCRCKKKNKNNLLQGLVDLSVHFVTKH